MDMVCEQESFASHPDEELMDLGQEFDRLKQEMEAAKGKSDEEFDALTSQLMALEREIAGHSATTIEGLAVKAKAANPGGGCVCDPVIVDSLANDVIQLAERTKDKTPWAAFHDALGGWHSVRGRILAGHRELGDKDMKALGDQEAEYVRTLWSLPADSGYQIFMKFEVLEQYLDKSDWCDERDLRLLASIKADLRGLLSS